MKSISVTLLKSWLDDDAELALLDVREHGQYGEEHLFFAVSLPYSTLEIDAPRLLPRKSVRIVVYGNASSGHVIDAYAARLQELGYTDISVLDGGIEAWRQAGAAVFSGVNLPGKTFGELVEHICETPRLTAVELRDKLRGQAEKIVVLDGRPVAEYRKMNIPGSICCPNAELPLRVGALVPDPQATIVVSCAGRTRGIIGAQTLINVGVPNKVYALENGTQGWFLSGFELEHGSTRTYDQVAPDIPRETLAQSKKRAIALAREFAIPTVTCEEVLGWLQKTEASVFVCDVRTPEEHERDHLPGVVQHTPGGQLIQAVDQYVGVQKSKIVLFNPDGIRATVVATWLKQMGRDVALLADVEGLRGCSPQTPAIASLPNVTWLEQQRLADFLQTGERETVWDARPSQAFRRAHVKGARWLIRSMLPGNTLMRPHDPALLIGDSRAKIELLARDLRKQGAAARIHGCVVDAAFPDDSGLEIVRDSHEPPDAECVDYLFFVHDRHDGNKEAARRYLQWETNLVSQLGDSELKRFSVKRRPQAT
ncbi:MAG: sulfurtransferase [Candidimonas sp.]|nr:MAG: sulfurtransferase [Candidimonas sp.]